MDMSRSFRSELTKPILIVLVVGAIALSTAEMVVLAKMRDWQLQTTDGEQYAANAESMMRGDGYSNFYWAPGYSAYIMLCKSIFGERFALACVVGQYAMIVLGAVVVARLIGTPPAIAIVVAAIFLISPQLINNASKLRNDTLCMALLLPAMVVMANGYRNCTAILIAGTSIGLACLVRNTALAVCAASAMWLFLPWGADQVWPQRVRQSILFVVAFGLTIAPWCVYASLKVGQPVLIASNMQKNIELGFTVAGEHKESANPIPMSDVSFSSYIQARALSFLSLWSPLPMPEGQSRVKWLAHSSMMWLATPGFLLAVYWLMSGRNWDRRIAYCIFTVLLYTCALAMVYARLRYRLSVEPLLYAASGWGWWMTFAGRFRDAGAKE